MRVIYKYSLSLSPWHVIDMPRRAQIIAVQTQGRDVCMWIMVDADEKVWERRAFTTHGTGRTDIHANETYVGTAQQGAYVWHVFEVKA